MHRVCGWTVAPETWRAKNTSIKLLCFIKLVFHIISWGRCTVKQPSSILLVLVLLPLALQPTEGFGLSNNVLPFFPICHQLSPSSHFQHLKIPFYFLFPSFTRSSSSSPPFQFLSEDFWASYPPPFSLGDLTSLSFALLSILLYFLLCSPLLVLDSSGFSIPRFHI